MLTWLRDNAKIFLIATIVIFVALIFLRWGMGERDHRPRNPYERPVAVVDGKDILPDEYQQALQSWTQRYRSMLEQSGNPDPESMLSLMTNQISDEAFNGLIDQKLQGIYLKNHNWHNFTTRQAEELLIAQIGMQDLGEMTAQEYLDKIKSEQAGSYQQYLYQTYMNGNSLRFPLASGMVSMASLEEVNYEILNNVGQITARYIVIDTIPPIPDEAYLTEFYASRPDLFITSAGSRLRYITVQVLPENSDLEFAMNRIDSLAYSTAGSKITATRSQLAEAFSDSIVINAGERTDPFLGMFSGNTSISSYHVLLMDSLHQSTDTLYSSSDDTLFLRSWEVPILPQYSTIRKLMWDLESGMDDMLAESIPQIPDSLVMVDFGEMLVEQDTPLTGIVSKELLAFASDTLWDNPVGPVFYTSSYRGGYPAFTMVKRLQYLPADTSSFEEAAASGLLSERAMYTRRRETSYSKALQVLNDIRDSNVNLATYAALESLQVFTPPAFTAIQIENNALLDPEAFGGILYSEEFAEAALVAPEFHPIGPFRTGSTCVIAEILSRQVPADNQNMQAMTYISTEYGHEQLAAEHIVSNLRNTSDIHDLRDEWSEYLETVQDSLRTQQEQLE